MPQGRLRVYLGVAPGAGTTHALLDEAARRLARGTDVVLGPVDTHGRTALETLLKTWPDRTESTDPTGSTDVIDVESLLRRRPSTVVVDDLERPNPPGHRHPHRWEDVEDLLAAGIDVIAALDVRAVASLAEPVERVTGERPAHTVPDDLLRNADQLELVDIAPQALRRRLAHGGLYPPEEIDAVRAATLRPSALAALRELAFTWATGTIRHQHDAWVDRIEVDRIGQGHEPPDTPSRGRPQDGQDGRDGQDGQDGRDGQDGHRDHPEAPDRDGLTAIRERLFVALSGGPESERVLHRAAHLADRHPGAELHAVHVLSARQLRPGNPPDVGRLRDLAQSVGAAYQQVIGDDVVTALLDIARAEHATQLVVGGHGRPATRQARPATWRNRSGTAARVVAAARDVEVHVVPAGTDPRSGMPPTRPGLSPRRRLTGLLLGMTLPVALTVTFQTGGAWSGLAGQTLLFLLAVVTTALVGGLTPAVLCAVVGSTLLNYYFIPPVHTFQVAESHNVLTLVLFVLIGVLVGAVVHRAASLAAQAARASAESRTLAAIAGSILRGEEALPTLLEQVRTAFGMTSASLLQRRPGDRPDRWEVLHRLGPLPPEHPEEADVQVPAGDGLVLALTGRTLAAADRTILQAFAAQARSLLERDRLARGAAVAARLKATERLRNALLAAVGHDLRTPLASATAAVTSLRSPDVRWSAQERDELLATAEESLTRLGRLVADLLDLSRLRAGVLTVASDPVWLDEVIPPALDELGPAARDVTLRLPDDLPATLGDGALVTRVLVNLLGNALRHSPPDRPPLVTASAGGDQVQVRVVDRGPGIPAQDLPRVFVPFQRLGDTDNHTGLGLGLALSRGLVEAMGGTLEPDETPGGGLTMVVSLPAVPNGPAGGDAEPGHRERGSEPEVP